MDKHEKENWLRDYDAGLQPLHENIEAVKSIINWANRYEVEACACGRAVGGRGRRRHRAGGGYGRAGIDSIAEVAVDAKDLPVTPAGLEGHLHHKVRRVVKGVVGLIVIEAAAGSR